MLQEVFADRNAAVNGYPLTETELTALMGELGGEALIRANATAWKAYLYGYPTIKHRVRLMQYFTK